MENKKPTQEVVEYVDGLTVDGKNIEFVSDVHAKPLSDNYVEVKLTFFAKSYQISKYKLGNRSGNWSWR